MVRSLTLSVRMCLNAEDNYKAKTQLTTVFPRRPLYSCKQKRALPMITVIVKGIEKKWSYLKQSLLKSL